LEAGDFVASEKKVPFVVLFFARPERLPKGKEDKSGKVGSGDVKDAVEAIIARILTLLDSGATVEILRCSVQTTFSVFSKSRVGKAGICMSPEECAAIGVSADTGATVKECCAQKLDELNLARFASVNLDLTSIVSELQRWHLLGCEQGEVICNTNILPCDIP
jgi:hypothetical protein